MISLMQQPKIEGYPDAYLFVRLRGKRVRVEQEESFSGSEPWGVLMDELRWVFATMRPGLRQKFAPCFLYFELRNLQMILRSLAGGDRQQLERIGRQSLLRSDLLRELLACTGVAAALAILDRYLELFVSDGLRLIESYEQSGARAAEARLTDGLLPRMMQLDLVAPVRDYLSGLIDLRNLLTAARYLRWEIDDPPLLTGDSGIGMQLRLALKREGRAGLRTFLARQLPEAVDDPALLELELLERFGRRWHRYRHDPLATGQIVDYLWQCYRRFRQAGLQRWGGQELAAWGGTG